MNGHTQRHISASRMGCALLLVALGGCQKQRNPEVDRLLQGARLIAAVERKDTTLVDSLLQLRLEMNLSPKRRASLAAVRSTEPVLVQRVYPSDTAKDGIDGKVSPLMMAAAGNQVAIAEYLLEQGADPNYADENGTTALIIATEHADGRLARLLLERGAKAELTEHHGRSALHGAVVASNDSLVHLLVQAGCPLETPFDPYAPRAPLTLAADTGDLVLVKYLVDAGANVNTVTVSGYTPLKCAVYEGHDEVVSYLLSKGATNTIAGYRGESALDAAIGSGNVRIASLLLKHGADVDRRALFSSSAVMRAAQSGHTEMIRFLARRGANVNERDGFLGSPLRMALQEGHTETALELLRLGARPDSEALEQAMACGDPRVLKRFSGMVSGASLKGERGQKLYWQAITSGNEYLRKLLRSRGVRFRLKPDDEEARDEAQQALNFAAKHNCVECIQELIAGGLDPNHESFFGLPLNDAAVEASVEAARALVKAGADVNGMEDVNDRGRGETALSDAILSGNHDDEARRLAFVKELVTLGADVNAINDDGNPPLYDAARTNNIDVTRVLLDAGADVAVRTDDSSTALHRCAYSDERHELLQLLWGAWTEKRGGADKALATELAELAVLYDAPRNAAFLLEQGSSPDVRSLAYVAAAREGSLQRLDSLEKAGMTLNDSIRNEVFTIGLARNDPAVARWALRSGACEPVSDSLVTELIAGDRCSSLRLLLERQPRLFARPGLDSAISRATESDIDDSTFALLINSGVRVSREKLEQRLAGALWYTDDEELDVELLVALVEAGADPRMCTGGRKGLLHIAAERSPLATRLLLALGAGADAVDSTGATPLKVAEERECEGCAYWLRQTEEVEGTR